MVQDDPLLACTFPHRRDPGGALMLTEEPSEQCKFVTSTVLSAEIIAAVRVCVWQGRLQFNPMFTNLIVRLRFEVTKA